MVAITVVAVISVVVHKADFSCLNEGRTSDIGERLQQHHANPLFSKRGNVIIVQSWADAEWFTKKSPPPEGQRH